MAVYNWAALVRCKRPGMLEPILFAQHVGCSQAGLGYFTVDYNLVVHGPYDAEGAALMTKHARAYFASSAVWELVWAGTDMDEARAQHAALTALES